VPDSLIDLAGLRIDVEEFLAAVLDTAAQPIWVVDPDDVIRFANPAAIAALGYEAADELVGRRSHQTIHYKHRDGTPYPAEECQMRLPRSKGETVSCDLDWFCRRDGSMFPVSYIAVPLEMAAGRGAVVAFTDIEDRLRAERMRREHDAVLADQQASLRRVAGLVTGGAASADVFAAIAKETAVLIGVSMVHVWRYDSEGSTATVLGAWSDRPQPFELGSVWPYGERTAAFETMQGGRPVRIEDFSTIAGPAPDAGRALGMTSMAVAPIVVDGELWGALAGAMTDGEPLPDRVEERLAEFTELVATAISNSATREQLIRLAQEQAALRRVATLVARESPPPEIFAAVAEEVAVLLDVEDTTVFRYEEDWTATVVADRAGDRAAPLAIGSRMSLEGESATALVRRTGRPARVDDFSNATGPLADYTRDAGIGSSVASPIEVDGRLWGAVVAATRNAEPMPHGTEARIGQFTELIASAISNVQVRSEVARLADEQAALRRVATVVARGASQTEVFTAIAKECGDLFGTRDISFVRFDGEEDSLVLASSGLLREAFPPGSRPPIGGDNATSLVYRTGKPVRIDDYSGSATGSIGETARAAGVRAAVATPIVVEGRLWGAVVVGSTGAERLPADTEDRLAQFTELMATAIANTESHAKADLLADEQAALQRVATLVAQGVEADELFAAVTKEFAGLFPGVPSFTPNITRFDPGPEFRLVGTSTPDAEPPLGWRWAPTDVFVSTRVWRTGRSAYVDAAELEEGGGPEVDYLRRLGFLYQAGSPIVVEGRLWGAMTVDSGLPLPPDTEQRLERFTELIATAIANIESRSALSELAEEQAALSRVATLVAEGVEPAALFAAVTKEVERLFVDVSPSVLPSIIRFDAGPEFVLVGTSKDQYKLPLGSRWGPKELYASTRVFNSGASVRVDATEVLAAAGPDSELLQEQGFLYQVGSPIIVEGQLWGAMTINSTDELPPDTDERLEKFTDLVVTAIANSESRASLRRLAAEQAGLRRVATVVAQRIGAEPVFDAVADEVEALFGADITGIVKFEPNGRVAVLGRRGGPHDPGAVVEMDPDYVVACVRATGEASRFDTDDPSAPGMPSVVRQTGLRSSVAIPLMVDGEPWGAITLASTGRPLVRGVERRAADFTELVATAISNAEARAEVETLANEQAALRRVATLVAEGAPPRDIFDAVITEVGGLVGAENMVLSRYEDEREATVVAHRGPMAAHVPAGSRVALDGENIHSLIRPTRRPARMEHWDEAHGTIARISREIGVRTAVGVPIIVEGELWGVMVASWITIDTAPADTESRMTKFADLLETAIANADTRDKLAASRVRLLTEADDARRRVVRDLHDGAQQRLVHSIITLKLARRALRGEDGDPASLVDEALAQAEQGNLELRELAHGILPSVLTRGGLRAGVDTVVARIALPIAVDITDERFTAEIEASAYFVVAETLTNVVKHARATSAEVKAWVEDHTLRVEVLDDGVGGADPAGHGLVGLSDRVAALGGSFTVATLPSGGTRASATFPL
jgi:PAS domain S-box-containing protein